MEQPVFQIFGWHLGKNLKARVWRSEPRWTPWTTTSIWSLRMRNAIVWPSGRRKSTQHKLAFIISLIHWAALFLPMKQAKNWRTYTSVVPSIQVATRTGLWVTEQTKKRKEHQNTGVMCRGGCARVCQFCCVCAHLLSISWSRNWKIDCSL